MRWQGFLISTIVAAALADPRANAATFGKVVVIGGEPADIVLDESRGVLYSADFTANRIEIVSLSDYSIQTAINVSHQPGALALSPDNRFLLVAQYAGPGILPGNSVTVIDLSADPRQISTFSTGDAPLGLAFMADGRAIIITNTAILFYEPVSGHVDVGTLLGSCAAGSSTLPVPLVTFPPQVIQAVVSTTPDRRSLYAMTGAAGGGLGFISYDVRQNRFFCSGVDASPGPLPRLSISDDGSYAMFHMYKVDNHGNNLAQFPSAAGATNVGGVLVDSKSKTIYAQILTGVPTSLPTGTLPGRAPVLEIMDDDNLTVRQRILMPQNITGRMVMNAAGDTIYAISDSGLMILPVGKLNQAHRVTASQSSMAARTDFCNRKVITMNVTVTDPGGGRTDFALSTNQAGVTISPNIGVTPAVVQVQVDPTAFQNQLGTLIVPITLTSVGAVNIPTGLRLLVNNRSPEQRGTFVDVPGTISDLVADPVRKRFYMLAHDRNLLMVFDGNNFQPMATLRTSTTPTQMAVSFDQKTLMIGHENSQQVYLWDLETLQPLPPIQFPPGHYAQSIAASGKALLATARSGATWSIGDGGVGGSVIDKIDIANQKVTVLPSLGIWVNGGLTKAVLAPAPNGGSIFVVSADGNVLLYDANVDTFTISRSDLGGLTGSYASSSFGNYVVGNTVLDGSLVPVATMETATGAGAGFAFVDQTALRTTMSTATNPGIIERMDPIQNRATLPTRMAEAPVATTAAMPFIRSLAPMFDRSAIISLTVSGFTVLPWAYDAPVAPPKISKVVNAADGTKPVAPGGLVSITGAQMSPVNVATSEIPLPTALGESCLTVNGVPMPLIFVSPTQVNAQIPFNVDGNATMIIHTPGGVSDYFNVSILTTAPSVFRGSTDAYSDLATITRGDDSQLVSPENPIQANDSITIYATGLGRTSPAVDSGMPAPFDDLAAAIIKPTVTLGGIPLSISYAGLAPGQVGVYQINAMVPSGIPVGSDVPLVIKQGSMSTNLSVQVGK